ncbi:cysteine desulfurase [Candidatus Kaiserbacteria bacterium]|nr:cysteine desulfurase [Candidatus Kaiserbacteria bacterium]
MHASDRIYLDYAAATPVRPEVFAAMQPYFSERFANPSAIHEEGRVARAAVEAARAIVAKLLKIRLEEVTCTSGGTEANNLALFGVVEAAVAGGAHPKDIEVISTMIEHPSVLEALDVLEKRGVGVRLAPVTEEGRIDMRGFETLLSPKTLLVTFAYVNSEVGVVEDVKRVVRTVREYERKSAEGRKVFIHLDASQAPLWLPCAMDALGVDLMTLDAGKCYGPKGAGVLAHKRHVPLRSQSFGGDQEGGLRAGTENVPLIVGCAEALHIAQENYEERADKVGALRDFFFKTLEEKIPNVLINGSREHRVANNCNISIPGIDGEFAVVTLDTHGIAASTRSACAGGKGSGSHVVAAITHDADRAGNTIRFTLGEETTREDLVHVAMALSEHANTPKMAL